MMKNVSVTISQISSFLLYDFLIIISVNWIFVRQLDIDVTLGSEKLWWTKLN